MKAYTDVEQSKKLAEILPLESADMSYVLDIDKWEYHVDLGRFSYWIVPKYAETKMPRILPCWSLAVLLDALPNEISTGEKFVDKYQIDIRKYDGGDGTTWYQIAYGNDRGSSGEWHDMINTGEKENIIDCCVQMILKLKEKDLL